MDNQDHGKNHAPGHESHGVYACHKCGWPFPNPHPSARHRRAHRKICGAIEGYKLVDSEGTANLAVSDDEHPSDEDRKTPSPKHLERSNNERGSGGVGERSNRTEDEVFSDAVAEFPDSGSSLGSEEHPQDFKESATKVETVSKNHTTTTQSYKDDAITVIIPPPCNSADSSRLQNAEVPESNLSGNAQESQDHVSSTSIGLAARSLIECGTEESAKMPNDDNVFCACDLNPIKLETQTDASQENKNNNAGKDLTKTDAKVNEGTNLDRHLLEVVVSPSDNASEASEAVSKLGRTEGIISDPAPAAGVVPSKTEHTDELVSKLSLSNFSPEAKSAEHVNASIDAAQIKVEATRGMDFASSGNSDYSVEAHDGKKEGNENMDVLSIAHTIPVVENAEIMIKGFKEHEGGKFPQFVNVDAFEVTNDVKDSVTVDDAFSFHSSLMNEGTEGSASGMHVLKDDLEQKDRSSNLVVEVSADEGVADVSQTKIRVNENQSSEDSGAPKDAVAIEMEKSHNVPSCKEDIAHDYCKDSSLASSLEHSTKIISDLDPMVAPMNAQVWQTANLFSKDDAGDNEKSRIEQFDIAGNDDKKRITEESCTEKIIATSEPTGILSECEVNIRSNLLGDENKADLEEKKTERCEVSGTETVKSDSASALVVENLSGKGKTSESASDLYVASVNAINVSEGKLPEPECTSLDRVLDTQESVKELESNGNDKIQVQCVGGVSTAVQSNNVGDVRVLLKSSEDHMIKEPLIYPLGTLSSIQNSATVEDIHDRDFVGVTSGNRSESLLDEGDNNLVAHQLGASANDCSVESSSQTDSLEGHWGSVSVLSTQSDIPAIVDAELLPSNGSQASAEAEKASLKKPLPVSETQHFDKSDVFEPPSFMTLVEPRAAGDQNAAASEIQTAQNQQQTKAGWFPSISLAASDSQGRKKNEAIIAKVTNWSTGKQQNPLKSQQHVCLKSLLGEATVETKSKEPNTKESSMPAVQKDETTAKDNGVLTAKVSSNPGPQAPVALPVKKEEGQEWNSPARYTADIKREKRKVKGRPYWAQFVCCSSVN